MKRLWRPEEIETLKDLYHNHTGQEIATLLDRNISSVYSKARALGLKTDPEFIRERGRINANHPNARASQFQTGHIPPNKGKKMSAEQYEKSKGTMFKKGQSPKNTMKIGTEIVRGDGYLWRKIDQPNKWKQVHRILWEEAHGPIPPGFNVQFKNKNSLDVRLENLYLISKADQLKNENSLVARYPEDLQKVIRLRGSIKRQITMYNKKQNEQET